MFGAVLDFLGNERNIEAAEDRQHDQQAFNSAESIAARDWQEKMSNTAVQRNKADLLAAGFNPLLAIHPGGGASTPTGAMASSGIASPHASPNYSASLSTAAQIEVAEAQADKLRAEADQIRTGTHPESQMRTREIESRIPVNQESVNKMQQEIAESSVRIEKLWEEANHLRQSAVNVTQQTANLKEMIPQIRATVNNLKALTAQASAATDEIKQRIKANLPDLERQLMEIERKKGDMSLPHHANEERAADSLIGQIGSYLDKLRGIIPNFAIVPRIGGPSATEKPESRKAWRGK